MEVKLLLDPKYVLRIRESINNLIKLNELCSLYVLNVLIVCGLLVLEVLIRFSWLFEVPSEDDLRNESW